MVAAKGSIFLKSIASNSLEIAFFEASFDNQILCLNLISTGECDGFDRLLPCFTLHTITAKIFKSWAKFSEI